MTAEVNPNNDAAKALNKKIQPFDGTTRIKEGAGYDPNTNNPNAGKTQIIDGVEYEIPANQTITIPNPENPNESIQVENKSRGRLGLPTNPEMIQRMKDQGTWIDENKKPETAEEMQARILREKEEKKQKLAVKAQEQIKIRIEMQGGKYTPPTGFENVPSLAPTVDQYQDKKPEANENLGEEVIEVEGASNTDNTDTGTAAAEQGPVGQQGTQ